MRIISTVLAGLVAVSGIAVGVTPSGWQGAVGEGYIACDFVSEGIVRVRYGLDAALADNGTDVVLPQPALAFSVAVSESARQVELTGGELRVAVDKDSGRVTFVERQTGRVILAEAASTPHHGERIATEKVVYDEKSARVKHTANGDVTVRDVLSRQQGAESCRFEARFDWKDGESLYGLGQHIEDTLDLRGHEVFLVQHNLKAVVPVLMSTEGYGILFDAGSAMRFDDRGGKGLYEIKAAKTLTYYFIRGEKFDTVVARYRKLTGECPMMPRYLFGYVQSKERYHSSKEIVDVVKRYRALGVPLDVIVQDWNYWPEGWGYLKMDPKHYPDPAALADDVHALNAKLMVSIWPNPQNCPQTKEFADAGDMLPNNCYNAFTVKGRAHYWQWVNREFFARGFDAWWCDCSEPLDADWWVQHPGYTEFSGEERARRNEEILSATLGPEKSQLYSLNHARGIYEHQRATTDKKRVVNLTRSSYAGQQRYATITWNGDTSADWASFKRQIPSGLNFMVTGCPYWTVDAGGFFVRRDPNLWFWRGLFPEGVKDPAYREYYVRMLQWAAYLPMMRSHGTDTPREIWHFGEKGTPHYDAIEKAIRERYALLPYVYSLAAKVTREGYTMARLLAFDFADDPKVRDLKDEYMFGPSLLIAPVTDPGAVTRKVYLPRFGADGGAWYDIRDGKKYAGGETVEVSAPIDSIPVFQKAGSIVVRGPVVQFADDQRGKPLEVTVAPGADASFTLYDDAGDGYSCEKGVYTLTELKWNDKTQKFTNKGNVHMNLHVLGY